MEEGIIGSQCAGMTELADVQDLGSCAARRVGSTPTTRTKTGDRPEGLSPVGLSGNHCCTRDTGGYFLLSRLYHCTAGFPKNQYYVTRYNKISHVKSHILRGFPRCFH